MIKVSELRIGNKISIHKGFEVEVVGIFKDGTIHVNFDGNEGDVWEVDEEDIEGIKITKEQLLNLEFKNPLQHIHQLQNLIHDLIGKELTENGK